MTRKPAVFSLVREQSVFLTVLMSVLSFLAVLCLGITISIGTSVSRFGSSFEKMATVQVMPGGDMEMVGKVLDASKSKIASMTTISDEEVSRMLRPWLGNASVLRDYVPKMIELKFKNKKDIAPVSEQLQTISNVRFLTHADGIRNTISAGWQIMIIAVFIMGLAFVAIGACVIYITRNIALVHKRELEIINMVGATDKFVARSLEKIIGRISAIAAGIGFVIAAIFLLIINNMAQNTHVGLMSGMHISPIGWGTLVVFAVVLIALSIVIAHRATLKVLTGKLK